jgi:hypothetical protein
LLTKIIFFFLGLGASSFAGAALGASALGASAFFSSFAGASALGASALPPNASFTMLMASSSIVLM